MTIFRYNDMTRSKFRPKSRHYNNLYDKIYEYVLNFKVTSNVFYIRKEKIAELFKVKVSEVEHILHQLNLLGLVSQPIHHAPHDSKREPWGHSESSDWSADIYRPQNIEYIFKKLKENNLTDSERIKFNKIISENSTSILKAFEEEIKLTEEEKRLFLKKGLNFKKVCCFLFEEYANTEWREQAFQEVLSSNEFCFNYIETNILTPSERKRAFNAILNSSKDRRYQSLKLPFFLFKLISGVQLSKIEKEKIMHKALKEKDGELALFLNEKTEYCKVNKDLQDKFDSFIVMYILEKEG